ncbi:hypothetical protein [Nocardioides sp. YIM 152315]|uniref:hypothetical protein n=1 Tax=Nocardioides sp. YIM 152315 TaxID=3031760 RepID=UPI0023DAC667|nr:hypothetical protein [Nocardioides sp. YIM 152315]MDF1605183.1 hypothetical protein [Nocardioides sp. YIM 152315]
MEQPDHRGPVLFLVLLALVALIVVAWGAGRGEAEDVPRVEPAAAVVEPPVAEPPAAARPVPELPGGGTRIFAGNRFLVAYYGTAQTAALGVLGESDPDTMDRRLRRAAAPFRRPGLPMRHVYELIVTVADASPGPDGNYSHDIPRAEVRRYLRAAHRNHALLLLDVQPGRSGFLETARRWEWALRDPWVGLALDPEWRMGPHEVPGRTIGQVRAREVNRTSAWLARLATDRGLPEKLFVLHQFRTDMIPDVAGVRPRANLSMVQHVDGFGTRQQKLATYHHVARPRQFAMGFKLFYDEDVRRMGPRQVHAIRPRVRFVSFQ